MKTPEKSKLTEEVKISKNSSINPSTTRDLEKAVQILRRGGLVIFPTDTVYGIGCKASDDIAIAKLKRIKGSLQKFPILISSMAQAYSLAKMSPQVLKLASHFWPGALTIILWDKNAKEKIGLRMPDSNLIRLIIEKLNSPIIGTSANFHGQKPPKTFKEIDKRLIKKVDFILKGRCKLGVESTVIDATFSPPRIIRRGAIQLQ